MQLIPPTQHVTGQNRNKIFSNIFSILPTDIAYIWLKDGSSRCEALFCPVIVRMNRFFRWEPDQSTAVTTRDIFLIVQAGQDLGIFREDGDSDKLS